MPNYIILGKSDHDNKIIRAVTASALFELSALKVQSTFRVLLEISSPTSPSILDSFVIQITASCIHDRFLLGHIHVVVIVVR